MLDYDAEVLTLDLFRRQESRTLLDTRVGENRLVAAPKASTKSSTGAVARHSHWRLFAVEGVVGGGASVPG